MIRLRAVVWLEKGEYDDAEDDDRMLAASDEWRLGDA